MCFTTAIEYEHKALEKRFLREFKNPSNFIPISFNLGFLHNYSPIIANDNGIIMEAQWGLIPSWAKDKTIQKQTLNARIETIKEKPSFKSNLQNRCLIPVTGFYEWKWLDDKGKRKERYLIKLQDHEIFCLAGIWCDYEDKNSENNWRTYTIITTEANELMAEIHNTKKRMPLILSTNVEFDWLDSKTDVMQFTTAKVDLSATII